MYLQRTLCAYGAVCAASRLLTPLFSALIPSKLWRQKRITRLVHSQGRRCPAPGTKGTLPCAEVVNGWGQGHGSSSDSRMGEDGKPSIGGEFGPGGSPAR